ncbi:MarR family transcriptional regulator [Pigmentiphaga sp.]|uniref:MarR family winged helix-turn-helix transcriptional regulator n=1 Tax=Pigmentiphaga sp. TaxID=1977564 RepID=UPI0025EE627C|nr:MarR family transcriptional regulator [Pigmentiphaga sp.]MBX6317029.1 MarR family transcriptional regulator [Pigmentiphaga sp.]
MKQANRLFELTNALQPVRRAWIQACAAVMAENGFSFPIATAVVLLSRLGDGTQQSALAEAAGVNPASMLRTLDLAEKAGLCERREVPHNRRIKALHLLAPGKALAKRVERQLAQLRKQLLEGIPPEDIDTVVRTLRTFEKNIYDRLS